MQFKSLAELNAYAKKQMEDIARTKLNDKIIKLISQIIVIIANYLLSKMLVNKGGRGF